MAIFLIGIPLSPNYHLAFVFAILAGVANSSMDAGSYPGLTELFPRAAGSASVLVKAFMSAYHDLSDHNIYFNPYDPFG